MAINQNVLARKIAAAEAGKVEVNIAQIKELLRCTLDILSEERPSDILKLLGL